MIKVDCDACGKPIQKPSLMTRLDSCNVMDVNKPLGTVLGVDYVHMTAKCMMWIRKYYGDDKFLAAIKELTSDQ